MFFCKHEWKILSETTTESRAEAAGRVNGHIPRPLDRHDLDPLYGKKLIQILTCKCGAIKKFVTEI